MVDNFSEGSVGFDIGGSIWVQLGSSRFFPKIRLIGDQDSIKCWIWLLSSIGYKGAASYSKGGLQDIMVSHQRDLSSFFKILTTSTDADNKVYVSTVHAYSYPVTSFQWHPEKNAFEWGLPMISHSEDVIQVTQHIGIFLVSEARKSLNRPHVRNVLENLIYNYSPTF